MTIAELLAHRVAGSTYDALSSETTRCAKIALLDTMGATLAGSRTLAVRMATLATAAEHSQGDCAILGTDRRAAALDAATINGTAAHVLDLDATSHTFFGHPLVHLFPAVFAACEMADADGRALIASLVVGYEVQTRIARAVQPRHTERGWLPTSTFGVFGAAAGAAYALGLPATQIAHALGLAAQFASGLMVNSRSTARAIAAGQSARNGLYAALLARAGATAAADSIEGSKGFLHVFNGAGYFDADVIGREWGDPFDIVEIASMIKLHPCPGVLLAPVDVACALALRHRISADEIERVEALLVTTRIASVDRPDPTSAHDAKFSAQYCLARALLQGKLQIDDFEGVAFRDPGVRALMSRIHVGMHPDTAKRSSRREQGGVAMTITLRDGRELRGQAELALGRVPGQPLTDAMLHSKFMDAAKRVLSDEAAGRALTVLRDLQTHKVRAVASALHAT